MFDFQMNNSSPHHVADVQVSNGVRGGKEDGDEHRGGEEDDEDVLAAFGESLDKTRLRDSPERKAAE